MVIGETTSGRHIVIDVDLNSNGVYEQINTNVHQLVDITGEKLKPIVFDTSNN